jgi:hypothetical protein
MESMKGKEFSTDDQLLDTIIRNILTSETLQSVLRE